jgi:hypothetical protein
LEIKFFPAQCEDEEERDNPVDVVCNNLRLVINEAILSSIQDLHYNEDHVKPEMCFRCESCSDRDLHLVKKGVKYHKMYCKRANANPRIPQKGRCWFNEGIYNNYFVCHSLLQLTNKFVGTELNLFSRATESAMSGNYQKLHF